MGRQVPRTDIQSRRGAGEKGVLCLSRQELGFVPPTHRYALRRCVGRLVLRSESAAFFCVAGEKSKRFSRLWHQLRRSRSSGSIWAHTATSHRGCGGRDAARQGGGGAGRATQRGQRAAKRGGRRGAHGGWVAAPTVRSKLVQHVEVANWWPRGSNRARARCCSLCGGRK